MKKAFLFIPVLVLSSCSGAKFKLTPQDVAAVGRAVGYLIERNSGK